MPKKKSLFASFIFEKLNLFANLILMKKIAKEDNQQISDENWSAEQFKENVIELLESIKNKK